MYTETNPDVTPHRCGDGIYNQEDVMLLLDEFARMLEEGENAKLSPSHEKFILFSKDVKTISDILLPPQ